MKEILKFYWKTDILYENMKSNNRNAISKVFSLFDIDSKKLQNNRLSNFKAAIINQPMKIAFALTAINRN